MSGERRMSQGFVLVLLLELVLGSPEKSFESRTSSSRRTRTIRGAEIAAREASFNPKSWGEHV
jgi:hypothetical protein